MSRISRLKKCLLVGASILFFGCTTMRKSSPAVVGDDRDKHGCIPSAGYVWSELRQDCIRPFELNIQLRETDDIVSKFIRQTGVLFSHDGKQCELFLNEQAMILKILDNNQFSAQFAKNLYTLRNENDTWQLLINDTIRFVELAK